MLIQLLLPTSGGASADGLAPLAQTRRELAGRFTGVTARRALERTFSAAASRAE